MKRYTPLRSGGRIKPNRKRRDANHDRAYGEKAEWIRKHPCCVPWCARPGVAAHTANGGMGRKGSNATLVPLCQTQGITEGHHDESHRVGVRTFERKYRMDLRALASEYEDCWQQYLRSGQSTSFGESR